MGELAKGCFRPPNPECSIVSNTTHAYTHWYGNGGRTGVEAQPNRQGLEREGARQNQGAGHNVRGGLSFHK